MGSQKEAIPPDAQALANALEVALVDRHSNDTSKNTIEFIRARLDELEPNFSSQEFYTTALGSVNDNAAMVEFEVGSRKHLIRKLWNGKITAAELDMLHPSYYNFQDSLVNKQLQELDSKFVEENMQDVAMVYDVSEDSEFVRAYLVNGRQLDEQNSADKKIIDLYDQYFHSWLVDNKMSSQDGVIFDTTKLDRKGNYTQKVKREEIIRLFESASKGLKTTLNKQKHKLGLEIIRNQPPTPAQEPTAAGG